MAKKKSTKKAAVGPMTFTGAVTPIGVDASWTGLAVTALVHGDHDMKPTGVRLSEVLSTKPADFPSQAARLESLGCQFMRQVFIAETGLRDQVLVAIEGYAMNAKWGREMAGELGGHLRILLWQAGIPYIIVPPSLVKKYVTGKGVAPKDVMMMTVFKRWGYESPCNNSCDAYVLSRIAAEFAAGGWTKKFEVLAQGFEVVAAKGSN